MYRTIDVCDSAGSLGLTSASTVQEVHDALDSHVMAFCMAMGMAVKGRGFLEYAPYWLVGYEGEDEPLFSVGTVNMKTYYYRLLCISPLYYDESDNTYKPSGGNSYSGSTGYAFYVLDIQNYAVGARYREFSDGTVALGFFLKGTSTSFHYTFLISRQEIDGKNRHYFISCAGSEFYVSAVRELMIGINAIHSVSYNYNIIQPGSVFCKKYGEIILNVPFELGGGIRLPEIFKMYTNRFSRAEGELISFLGRKYEIFQDISRGTMIVDVTEE
ncbi:MAG: hypothetical protein NC489_19610 [Ruminococcus flavefaciens]|nr:hypothetical protein [Ruminococcus flavefaciens]